LKRSGTLRAMTIKKFNWVKRPTMWEYSQAWKSHRSNMVRRFLDDGAAASAAFANAQNNMVTGMATLAAQASILRSQNELAAAKARLTSSIDMLA
jgi:hypothetical protein